MMDLEFPEDDVEKLDKLSLKEIIDKFYTFVNNKYDAT